MSQAVVRPHDCGSIQRGIRGRTHRLPASVDLPGRVAGSVFGAQSAALAAGLSFAWLLFSLAFFAVLMRWLGALFERRRENLLLVATGR